jgi:hypothetical protein
VPTTYYASDYRDWEAAGLRDYGSFAECVTFTNQTEYGDGQLEGNWYYCDDDRRVIYHGTFGNYNSPGSDHDTYADVYGDDETADYEATKAKWDAEPEYEETDDDGLAVADPDDDNDEPEFDPEADID